MIDLNLAAKNCYVTRSFISSLKVL